MLALCRDLCTFVASSHSVQSTVLLWRPGAVFDLCAAQQEVLKAGLRQADVYMEAQRHLLTLYKWYANWSYFLSMYTTHKMVVSRVAIQQV